MSNVTPYAEGWADLSDEQQLVALSERKLGKRQAELGVYLMAELNKDAAEIITILDAIREFNASKRGAGTEGEKRVPVAQQVVHALEERRDVASTSGLTFQEDAAPLLVWIGALNEAISVAGRYV